MKLSLLVTTLLLGASAAQASTVVLAECRGSVVKGSVGENYTIELNTDDNSGASKLVVNSQYNNGYSIEIPVSKGTVETYTAETIKATAKKGYALSYEKKSLYIDFVTGNGYASSYEPLDMLTKDRVIYLTYCTR